MKTKAKLITLNRQEKCVMARIMRLGKRHQKNFTLRRYKTWTAAKKAARRWAERTRRKLPPSVRNQTGRMTVRNHSGYVGVSLSQAAPKKHLGDPTVYWAWKAGWVRCPNRGGVTFGIRTLGDADAFVCAVLSHKMKTVNRDRVFKRLNEIRGTAEYRDIRKLKKQSAPADGTKLSTSRPGRPRSLSPAIYRSSPITV